MTDVSYVIYIVTHISILLDALDSYNSKGPPYWRIKWTHCCRNNLSLDWKHLCQTLHTESTIKLVNRNRYQFNWWWNWLQYPKQYNNIKIKYLIKLKPMNFLKVEWPPHCPSREVLFTDWFHHSKTRLYLEYLMILTLLYKLHDCYLDLKIG